MAKKQSFGDKVLKRRQERKIMAKVIVAESKPNGSFRFREKMVPQQEVQAELKALR
ncbi:MAG: hypothetical protein OXE59_04025 [Bacteroidetes bacterium]|nr:hypothetical protein [Bacteroidota bacterium]MCY4232896.1 hypothetical protein [Bacteroidota bacterium]